MSSKLRLFVEGRDETRLELRRGSREHSVISMALWHLHKVIRRLRRCMTGENLKARTPPLSLVLICNLSATLFPQ